VEVEAEPEPPVYGAILRSKRAALTQVVLVLRGGLVGLFPFLGLRSRLGVTYFTTRAAGQGSHP